MEKSDKYVLEQTISLTLYMKDDEIKKLKEVNTKLIEENKKLKSSLNRAEKVLRDVKKAYLSINYNTLNINNE